MVAVTIYAFNCGWIEWAIFFAMVVFAAFKTAILANAICANVAVVATAQTLNHFDFYMFFHGMI